MPDSTRISLLERLRETTGGDSWTEFVGLYDSMILNWLRSQGVQEQDASDVRQEVLATLCKEIPNFRHNGRPGAFRAWLRRITANRLKQQWRARQRNPGAYAGPDLSSIARDLDDDSSRLTHVWDQKHDQWMVEHLLDQLRDRFQPKSLAVFRAIALDGEDAQQAADRLGMTLGAARVAQHRVLRALRELGTGLLDLQRD